MIIELGSNLSEGVGSSWDSFEQGQQLKVGKGASERRANCMANGMQLEQMVSEQMERVVFP